MNFLTKMLDFLTIVRLGEYQPPGLTLEGVCLET